MGRQFRIRVPNVLSKTGDVTTLPSLVVLKFCPIYFKHGAKQSPMGGFGYATMAKPFLEEYSMCDQILRDTSYGWQNEMHMMRARITLDQPTQHCERTNEQANRLHWIGQPAARKSAINGKTNPSSIHSPGRGISYRVIHNLIQDLKNCGIVTISSLLSRST